MMKKLIMIAMAFGCLSLWGYGQSKNRAINVPLNPDRIMIYDSLFNANDFRKEKAFKAYGDSVYGKGNWLNKMLKVGERIPDLPLGDISNAEGKSRFSDYKGKLVILDFWTGWCSDCIAAFPKMEALQKKFADRIQIILVNPAQTKEQTEKFMGHNFKKVPDLPAIYDGDYLFPYFPRSSVPYHVWIDGAGVVRLFGSGLNTYEQKIQEFLDGKKIDFLPTEGTRPAFNATVPYYKLVGHKIEPKAYNSFFTSFNKDYAPIVDNRTFNQVDSVNGSIRNTFVNLPIKDLYKEVINRIKLGEKNRYIIQPYPIIYKVQDTFRYEFQFLKDKTSMTEGTFIKPRFCYEQVYEKGISDKESGQMMLDDLNTYFGKLYGTYGRLEKRLLPSYIIQKMNKQGYKKLFSKNKEDDEIEKIKDGKKWIIHKGLNFRNLFLNVGGVRREVFNNKRVLINDSGIGENTKIDIELPANTTLADIKKALKPYGLEIVEKNAEVELLVISDTKAK